MLRRDARFKTSGKRALSGTETETEGGIETWVNAEYTTLYHFEHGTKGRKRLACEKEEAMEKEKKAKIECDPI